MRLFGRGKNPGGDKSPGGKSGSRGGGLRRGLGRVFNTERLLGLAMLAGLMAAYVIDPYPVEFLRLKTFDLYQQIRPRAKLPPPPPQLRGIGDLRATIVDIDENSINEVGQWPWPRDTLAQLVLNLTQFGAAVIAFDMVFPEQDRMNPSYFADTRPDLDATVRDKLRELPGNDQVFAEAIKRSRVVLGQAGYWEAREADVRPPIRKTVGVKGSKPDPFLSHFVSMVHNVDVLEQAAAGFGVFSLDAEADGIIRRLPTLMVHGDDIYPSLSVEMLRVLFQRPTLVVETDAAGVKAVGIASKRQAPPDGLVIATDEHGRVWPYFSKHDRDKYVSARDVLAGVVDPEKIRNRLVLIGTSAVGLLDIRAIPTEKLIPGVEVHAQFIESALTGQALRRPNNIRGAELMILGLAGLLMVVLVPWVGAQWTMLLFLTVSGASAGTSWYLFTHELLLFDASFIILSMLLLYTVMTYSGYAKEEAQRRQVRDAFGFYLSPAMVERLAEDPSHLKLGGETRNMTMLFCDVRGFTSISELFDAEGLTNLINKLLTPLTAVILRRRGTVDKYMGDCIMAFWNAPLDDPDHARHAVLSALEMNASMGPLNDTLEAEAKAEGRRHIPLKIGIGCNSGDVVVGNMGSDQRFDYSVLGDAVNLASRLEGQCKTYAVDLVIGENTHAQCPDLACLELDLIRVKGKLEPVRIFTVLGDPAAAQSAPFLELKASHDAMLAAYRAQAWAAMREHLAACRGKIGDHNLAGLYTVFEERAAHYEANPPGEDWDGVFVATTK